MKFNIQFLLKIFLLILFSFLLFFLIIKIKSISKNTNNSISPTPTIIPKNLEDKNIKCPADVKQCPNGTYVSRTAPSCDFTPCL